MHLPYNYKAIKKIKIETYPSGSVSSISSVKRKSGNRLEELIKIDPDGCTLEIN